MNATILTGLCSLLIGIAVGWLLKPEDTVDPREADHRRTAAPGDSNDPRRAGSPSPSGSSDRSRSGPSAKSAERSGTAASPEDHPWGHPDEDGNEVMRQAQERSIRMMQAAHDAQLKDLAAKLGLTPEQQETLREKFYQPTIDVARFWNNAGPNISQLSPPATPDLAEVLAGLLSDDQVTVYEELHERNRRAQREASTLRQLADLTFLELSPDQRDATYDLLYEKMEGSPFNGIAQDTLSAFSSVTFASPNEPGGSPDADDLAGLVESVVVFGSNSLTSSGIFIPGDPDDPEVARRREEIIEQDANRFAEIFTPAQMDSYRTHLNNRHRGGGAFFGASPHLPALPK